MPFLFIFFLSFIIALLSEPSFAISRHTKILPAGTPSLPALNLLPASPSFFIQEKISHKAVLLQSSFSGEEQKKNIPLEEKQEALFEKGFMAYSAGNYAQAYQLFLTSESGMDGLSDYFLGILFYQGKGVPQKASKAAYYFEKAGKKGVAPALHDLALLYRLGEGVGKNLQKAFAYMKQAAELGDLPAEFNLAQYYRKGVGIQASPQQAFFWYLKSAEEGFLPSCYEVSLAYASGSGTHIDLPEAYAWILVAKEQEMQIDKEYLSILEKELQQSGQFLQAQSLGKERSMRFKEQFSQSEKQSLPFHQIQDKH